MCFLIKIVIVKNENTLMVILLIDLLQSSIFDLFKFEETLFANYCLNIYFSIVNSYNICITYNQGKTLFNRIIQNKVSKGLRQNQEQKQNHFFETGGYLFITTTFCIQWILCMSNNCSIYNDNVIIRHAWSSHF